MVVMIGVHDGLAQPFNPRFEGVKRHIAVQSHFFSDKIDAHVTHAFEPRHTILHLTGAVGTVHPADSINFFCHSVALSTMNDTSSQYMRDRTYIRCTIAWFYLH